MPTTKASTAYSPDDFMVVNNMVRGLQKDLQRDFAHYDGITGMIAYLKKVPKRDRRIGEGLRLLQQGVAMWVEWMRTHPGVAAREDEGGKQMMAKRNTIFQNAANILGESLGNREGFDPHNVHTRSIHATRRIQAIRKAKEEGYQDGYDDGIEACLDFKKDDKDDKDKMLSPYFY